jgi:hypothetical protein
MATFAVTAGADQTTTDSTALVLTGVVTEGTIPLAQKVLWTKDSGPDCAFTASGSWINQVFELSAGSYVFRLTAWDIDDTSVTDTVAVTVTHTTGPIYSDDKSIRVISQPYVLPFVL